MPAFFLLSEPWKEGLKDFLDCVKQMQLLISTIEHGLNGSDGSARIKSVWTSSIRVIRVLLNEFVKLSEPWMKGPKDYFDYFIPSLRDFRWAFESFDIIKITSLRDLLWTFGSFTFIKITSLRDLLWKCWSYLL